MVRPSKITMGDCSLTLERSLGITSLNNATLAASKNGSLFYVAGCVAILHDTDEGRQKQFYRMQHAISCLTLSPDGKFIAVGERGHNPKLVVFDVLSGEEVMALEMHKHGIGCAAFDPSGKYLVSASFKVDKLLCIWNWRAGKCISKQKIGNKVHSIGFHPDGDYFVTCGDKHLKWWHLKYDNGDDADGYWEYYWYPRNSSQHIRYPQSIELC